MDHVHAPVESCGLAEEDVFAADLQLLVHPFDALEEYRLHLAAAVPDPHAHSLDCVEFKTVGRWDTSSVPALPEKLHPKHPCPKLDIGHVRTGIRYPDE